MAQRPSLGRDPSNSAKGNSRRRHKELANDLLAPQPFAPRTSAPSLPRRSTGHRRPLANARERFIHSNYRFLLKPGGDYTVHFCDPDIHFDWTDVLQVVVPTSSALPHVASTDGLALIQEAATCPICLSEPTAPRMSRCGHVYCYPCILRYLELSDTGAWRKCPVCQDSIHSKDLKAVRWFDASAAHQLAQAATETPLPPSDQPVLTMRLVERPQITTLGLPRSGSWPSSAVPPNAAPWHFTPDAEIFAHFMLASPELILESLERDLEQIQAEDRLTRTLAKANGRGVPTDSEITLVFIGSARRKVKEQMEKAEALKTGAVLAARKAALKDLAQLASPSLLPVQPEASTSGSSDADDVPDAYVATLRGPAPQPPVARRRGNVNPPPPHDTTFTYYQVASGQNIYLSPLDTKILTSHFGDALPPVIHVPVEHHEDKAMTPDIRKRYKHLAHLPTASEISFVEGDLSFLVPPTALEGFSQQLKSRKSQRANRSRKEDRDLRVNARRHAEVQAATRVPEFRLPAAEEQRAIEMPALPSKPVLSTSPPVHDASVDDERTVWGTRRVALAPSPTLAATQPEAPAEDDGHWRALEEELALEQIARQTQPPGSRGKRSKGVKLNLSGGGRGR